MSRISEVSLDEDFARRGRWWLPRRKSDTIAGELSFSERGIRLKLDGHFDVQEFQDPTSWFGSRFKAPLILGQTVEGEFCMLLRSVVSGFDGGTRSFAPRYLLISEEPLGKSEPLVTEVLVQFSHLEDWAGKQLLRMNQGSSPETFSIAVATSRAEILKIQSDTAFKTLTLWTGVASRFKPGEVHLSHRSHFEIVFPSAQTLDSTTRFIGLLADLMTLLIGETAYITKVRIIPKSDAINRSTVDVFSSWMRGDTAPVRAPEMCCPLDKLSAVERGIFASWFEHAEKLKPVYDLLLSTMRGGQAHLQMDFLNLIQALETFHRRVYVGLTVPPNMYAPVRDALKRAIPPGTPTPLVEKLDGLLEYGNELSLKKRLMYLCSTLKRESVESILGVSEDRLSKFLQLLTDMRNYRTHYDEKLSSRVKNLLDDLVAAYNLNVRLRALTTLLLLEHLGLDETKLVNGLASRLQLAY
jgi:hypothetical protein